LKPGTEVGAGRVPDAAGSPAPLLVISDQIAAAAAPVADAVSGSRNVTKRAAAAAAGHVLDAKVGLPLPDAISHIPSKNSPPITRSDSLARKGTVPWGNDPKYVSLNT
jgi:hypothetical protein